MHLVLTVHMGLTLLLQTADRETEARGRLMQLPHSPIAWKGARIWKFVLFIPKSKCFLYFALPVMNL